MCSNFSMSSWSFVSDDAFFKVFSVGRKDCKWILHNVNLDTLHNSNKKSRCLYKMDTNSAFPAYILTLETKLQKNSHAYWLLELCLLILYFLFCSILFLKNLFSSDSSWYHKLHIPHHLFLFRTKPQSPSHTINAFAKKTNEATPLILLITFLYVDP